MPVFPPPMVYNTPMPEQLPEPSTTLNFNETTPIHQRIEAKPINPKLNIAIKFNEVNFLEQNRIT